MENLAKGVVWNLSDLYSSMEDPRIPADLKTAAGKAIVFEQKYKPLFLDKKKNGPLFLPQLLKDYKEILVLLTKPGVFTRLLFAQKTNDPAIGGFLQKIQSTTTDIQTHLLFFEVYWNRLDEKTASRWINDPLLKNDRHFLEKTRLFAPHTLGEGEEKIMSIKSNTSGSAFSRLFDEVTNSIPFYADVAGQRVRKNLPEVLSMLHSTDRAERKKSSESLAEGLKNHSHLLTYIYNMILADHRDSMKIRKFRHPMDAMNLANEISLKSVQNLIRSVKDAYPLAARYYRLKRKLLGLDKLYDYDRYASLESEEEHLPFDQCRQIVLSGFYEFSEEVGKIAEPFFSKRWIDAEVREGKHSGGFCSQTIPDLHSYILVNYSGSLRDVMVVAHELGHGLHQMLSRKAGILESGAPLTMAETASVFGEMVIFEKLLSAEKDPKKRLALLCGKIDDNFATVYRQIAMTEFELKAHQAALEEGELSSQRLSDFWIQANAQMYGDSVELTENYREGWKYIPHFVHSPFYCYAYAFAQLFVLCLYEKYKRQKKAFIPKYLEALSLGGSRKPEEIASGLGLDIGNPSLWQDGLALLEKLVAEAELLAGT